MPSGVLQLLVGAVALVALAAGGAAWQAFRDARGLTHERGYVHPRPDGFAFSETPLSAHGLAFEPFETQIDGATVRGWLVPAPGGAKDLAVIALHGRGGDRASALPLAPMLHEAGATVAFIDLRENGLSDGSGRGTGLAMREAEDALAVAADLRARGFARIALYGCSLGASAAIIAAARDRDISAVIAESPIASFRAYARDVFGGRFERFGMGFLADPWAALVVAAAGARQGLGRVTAPADVIGAIAPRPVLLIDGARDAVVTRAHAETLARRAGEGAVLWVAERAGHCDAYAVEPEAFAARVRATLAPR
jgi:alpha-beta hydrolase superfamily lysophospholipase